VKSSASRGGDPPDFFGPLLTSNYIRAADRPPPRQGEPCPTNPSPQALAKKSSSRDSFPPPPGKGFPQRTARKRRRMSLRSSVQSSAKSVRKTLRVSPKQSCSWSFRPDGHRGRNTPSATCSRGHQVPGRGGARSASFKGNHPRRKLAHAFSLAESTAVPAQRLPSAIFNRRITKNVIRPVPVRQYLPRIDLAPAVTSSSISLSTPRHSGATASPSNSICTSRRRTESSDLKDGWADPREELESSRPRIKRSGRMVRIQWRFYEDSLALPPRDEAPGTVIPRRTRKVKNRNLSQCFRVIVATAEKKWTPKCGPKVCERIKGNTVGGRPSRFPPISDGAKVERQNSSTAIPVRWRLFICCLVVWTLAGTKARLLVF